MSSGNELPLENIKKALAEYISILETSVSDTNWAEDRPRYQSHLAEAALMFAAIEKDRSLEKVKKLVASEQQGYGWGYLNDAEGKAAEAAFNVFVGIVKAA